MPRFFCAPGLMVLPRLLSIFGHGRLRVTGTLVVGLGFGLSALSPAGRSMWCRWVCVGTSAWRSLASGVVRWHRRWSAFVRLLDCGPAVGEVRARLDDISCSIDALAQRYIELELAHQGALAALTRTDSHAAVLSDQVSCLGDDVREILRYGGDGYMIEVLAGKLRQLSARVDAVENGRLRTVQLVVDQSIGTAIARQYFVAWSSVLSSLRARRSGLLSICFRRWRSARAAEALHDLDTRVGSVEDELEWMRGQLAGEGDEDDSDMERHHVCVAVAEHFEHQDLLERVGVLEASARSTSFLVWRVTVLDKAARSACLVGESMFAAAIAVRVLAAWASRTSFLRRRRALGQQGRQGRDLTERFHYLERCFVEQLDDVYALRTVVEAMQQGSLLAGPDVPAGTTPRTLLLSIVDAEVSRRMCEIGELWSRVGRLEADDQLQRLSGHVLALHNVCIEVRSAVAAMQETRSATDGSTGSSMRELRDICEEVFSERIQERVNELLDQHGSDLISTVDELEHDAMGRIRAAVDNHVARAVVDFAKLLPGAASSSPETVPSARAQGVPGSSGDVSHSSPEQAGSAQSAAQVSDTVAVDEATTLSRRERRSRRRRPGADSASFVGGLLQEAIEDEGGASHLAWMKLQAEIEGQDF